MVVTEHPFDAVAAHPSDVALEHSVVVVVGYSSVEH